MQAQGELKKLATVIQKAIEVDNLLRDNRIYLVSVDSEKRSAIFSSRIENSHYGITLEVTDFDGIVEHSYRCCLSVYHRKQGHTDSCFYLTLEESNLFCYFACKECSNTGSPIFEKIGTGQFPEILDGKEQITSEEEFAIITAIAKLFRSAN